MSDNVLILGAGFSHDAGIPLMDGIVDRMWEIATRQSYNGIGLKEEDLEIFKSAMKVRREIDAYHGRANFNDRNIEDILSILSFEKLAGGRAEHHKLQSIISALARTIDLSCSLAYPGLFFQSTGAIAETGPQHYRDFWMSLFEFNKKGFAFPSIITFNYDLVLERSLLQVLFSLKYFNRDKRPPFENIQIKYYQKETNDLSMSLTDSAYFNKPKLIRGTPPPDTFAIEILKLHGSLNFSEIKQKDDNPDSIFAGCAEQPHILPPIINKISSNVLSSAWSIAIQRLRHAKNIIIVGYSLPRTDVYMQYFFKAALGPNSDLNRIFVFDPALYRSDKSANEIISRYHECFAQQLQRRIEFLPIQVTDPTATNYYGTTKSFIHKMSTLPKSLMF